MNRRLLVAMVLAVMFVSSGLSGQSPSSSISTPVSATALNLTNVVDTALLKKLTAEYDRLSARIDTEDKLNALAVNYRELTEKVETNTKATDRIGFLAGIFFGIFTLLFGVGTAFSIYGWVKTEQRTRESHQWERGAQAREESIFKQSQETLTLVNETLGLAKEASSRASKSLENKLKRTAQELERSARKLIDESGAYEDDKQLVLKKEITARIHSLGNKIKALANNIVILEDHTFDLEPHCVLIRAIDSHLAEDYADALENLEIAAQHRDSSSPLKVLAYYYLGYINNNLGEFHAAIVNFSKALKIADGARKYEIRRILLESRFFNKEDGDDLIREFHQLLRAFDADFGESPTKSVKNRRIKIQNTLGNIYYQVGNETKDVAAREKYYTEAEREFAAAVDNQAPDKWVLFGLAEAKYKLGKLDESAAILERRVIREVEKEYLNREELRTKVLAKTTQLICSIRCRLKEQDVKECRDEVISALGNVDNRLTIYSQLQRRNVVRLEFYKEIDALTAGYLEPPGDQNVESKRKEISQVDSGPAGPSAKN